MTTLADRPAAPRPAEPPRAEPAPATRFIEDQVAAARAWMDGPRFERIVRLHTARDVAEQQGSIPTDNTVARIAAEAFHARLRELFASRRQITTFGPYSPG